MITDEKILKDVYKNVISKFSDMRYGSFLDLVDDGDINIFASEEAWWNYRQSRLEELDLKSTTKNAVYAEMDDDGNIRKYKNMIIELF